MPVLKPKIRGFICTTSHPDGCAAHVQEQIDYVKSQPALEGAPKKVLVIGSSTGYGLASRIVPAFNGGAATMGVFFEKEGTDRKSRALPDGITVSRSRKKRRPPDSTRAVSMATPFPMR